MFHKNTVQRRNNQRSAFSRHFLSFDLMIFFFTQVQTPVVVVVVVVVVVAFIYSRLLNRHKKVYFKSTYWGGGGGEGEACGGRGERTKYKHFKLQYGESLLTLTQRIAKG